MAQTQHFPMMYGAEQPEDPRVALLVEVIERLLEDWVIQENTGRAPRKRDEQIKALKIAIEAVGVMS